MVEPFFLMNCVTEPRVYNRQYSIKNISGTQVKLKFYRVSSNELISEVILSSSQVYNGENLETDQPPSNYPDSFEPVTSYPSSFIEIIYNSERKKAYRWNDNGVLFSEPINRNPFRHGNYENIGGDHFQYTITQEDYNNAEDCNGNCD